MSASDDDMDLPGHEQAVNRRAREQARLPAMVRPDEVSQRQKQDDMKAFRKYLVDTGSVKCLTKMYMNIYKNEMRMDNPMCAKDFLASYQEAAAEDKDSVVEANTALRDRNAELLAQVDALTQMVASLASDRAGFSPDELYSELTEKAFWEGAVGEALPSDASITLGQLFLRLCGGSEQAALLTPVGLQGEAAEYPLSRDAFRMWVARDLSDSERGWVQDILLPSLAKADGGAPFEQEVVDSVNDSGLYPDSADEVAGTVSLDISLQAFLESAAHYAAGLAEAAAAAATAEAPEDQPAS